MTAPKTDKHCKRCDTTKSLDEFGNKKGQKQIWCLPCTRGYYNKWRKANPTSAAKCSEDSFRAFYSTIRGRAVHMNNNTRRRASVNEVAYQLSVEWFETKIMAGICEATGLPLVLRENGGKGHRTNSFSPSVDRIDQTGPYSPNNCQMTCWIYNRAKGAFPIDDLLQMARALITLENPLALSLTNPVAS